MEAVTIDVPEEFVGSVIEKLGGRKGEMTNMYPAKGGYTRLELSLIHIFMMMENYRSTPEILSVANSLIAKNQNRMQKDLLPTLPGGKPVLCHHGKTAEEEAIWMAKKIEELHQDGVPYREITILYLSLIHIFLGCGK